MKKSEKSHFPPNELIKFEPSWTIVSPVPIKAPIKLKPNLDPFEPEKELFIGLLTIDKESSLFLWIPDFICSFNLETANDEVGFGMLGLFPYSWVFF